VISYDASDIVCKSDQVAAKIVSLFLVSSGRVAYPRQSCVIFRDAVYIRATYFTNSGGSVIGRLSGRFPSESVFGWSEDGCHPPSKR
jgi:hypothetical protein